MSSLSEQLLDRAGGQGAHTGDDLREAPGPRPWQQSSLGPVPPRLDPCWKGPAASACLCWYRGQSHMGTQSPLRPGSLPTSAFLCPLHGVI